MPVDPINRAINGAYAFCEEQQAVLDNGFISDEFWFEHFTRHFTDLYLVSANMRGQFWQYSTYRWILYQDPGMIVKFFHALPNLGKPHS